VIDGADRRWLRHSAVAPERAGGAASRRTGDAGAVQMIRDTLVGRLAHLRTFLDPEVLLVGGSLRPSAEACGVRRPGGASSERRRR